MFKRLLLAALLVLVGLAAGTAMPRPSVTVGAAPAAPELPPAPPAPTPDTCRSELVNAKAQLAICLAFRGSPESSAAAPAPRPPVEMDEETARLVRTHTTNTEPITVQSDCGNRIYAPGTWPPPGGPTFNARISARFLDGGVEFHAADGGVRFVATNPSPLLCPCPKDADGGPGASP